jgi:hypothetical protein
MEGDSTASGPFVLHCCVRDLHFNMACMLQQALSGLLCPAADVLSHESATTTLPAFLTSICKKCAVHLVTGWVLQGRVCRSALEKHLVGRQGTECAE